MKNLIKNKRAWIITGGIFGFLGVAIGAFGAHGLSDVLNSTMMGIYKTGVLYQLIHAVVILAIGLAGDNRFFIAAALFTVGIILFSFSLYVYSMTGIVAVAMVTPLGGLCFLAGWFLVIIRALKKS